MARSVGESPRSSSSQALRRDVERATWKTENAGRGLKESAVSSFAGKTKWR